MHTAQLMRLPLTVSCSSKIQIGFTFLVPAYPDSPGQRAVKRVCVCVCVLAYLILYISALVANKLLICDYTFFLILLFQMRHVIFSLNEYVMLNV